MQAFKLRLAQQMLVVFYFCLISLHNYSGLDSSHRHTCVQLFIFSLCQDTLFYFRNPPASPPPHSPTRISNGRPLKHCKVKPVIFGQRGKFRQFIFNSTIWFGKCCSPWHHSRGTSNENRLILRLDSPGTPLCYMFLSLAQIFKSFSAAKFDCKH